MRYVLLIHSNRESWATLSADGQRALGRAHADFTTELTDAGRLVASEGLADPVRTRTVRVRDGVTVATDGPFVESKEHLAGFYVVECDGEDDAVALATRLPDARIDAVEVRPVADA